MIRGGFLSDAERQALTAMARDGLAEHRIARRANAIVLLDKGWSCARVAGARLLDDDTMREWYQAYETGGLDALSRFGHECSSCRLTLEQQAALQNWITVRLPRSTRTIGAWLEKNHGFNYGRSGLIALLHRLGFDYREPHKMPRGLNDVRQMAFIADYEKLLNTMAADEAVEAIFAMKNTSRTKQRLNFLFTFENSKVIHGPMSATTKAKPLKSHRARYVVVTRVSDRGRAHPPVRSSAAVPWPLAARTEGARSLRRALRPWWADASLPQSGGESGDAMRARFVIACLCGGFLRTL